MTSKTVNKIVGTPIIQVAIPSPLRTVFNYLLPKKYDLEKISSGIRVLVPFGKREVVGVILSIGSESSYDFDKLKEVIDLLDDKQVLPNSILSLIDWTSDYYNHPIGDVVSNALPSLLRKKPKRKTLEDYTIGLFSTYKLSEPNNQDKILRSVCPKIIGEKIKPNEEQQNAIDEISKGLNKFTPFLLDGVTGSGKTEVYLQVIAKVLEKKKQALILIPEISLTPQTIERFSKRFTVEMAVIHSRLTYKEKLISWLKAKEGIASIIIGTRSAVFTPMKNPGIIIVDEEHDQSFKQNSGLRYSARDLAVVRGKIENIPVVLGSATPSIESVHNVKRNRYTGLKLSSRAGGATQPSFHIVDMRSQKLKEGIAEGLLVQIKKHLENNGQVLVFLNRRGFAPILICNSCGWNAQCKHCDARMTIHHKKNHLRCHHCGSVVRIPASCPKCNKGNLVMLGIGTERVELLFKELFPNTKVARIDRDTTSKKDSMERVLDEIQKGEHQILIGTQMLAKGHHFPNVTMVAILNVDQSLFGLDFRCSEHLAQLIMQVAGRAGRDEKPGEVYLQTHNPHHPLLLNLINFGYQRFVNDCLNERQLADMPPYSYLALFQAEAKMQEKVFKFLKEINFKIGPKVAKGMKIFGPVATAMEKKAGYFRAQLLLQSKSRKSLQQTIDLLLSLVEEKKIPSGLRWFLDVDPIELC